MNKPEKAAMLTSAIRRLCRPTPGRVATPGLQSMPLPRPPAIAIQTHRPPLLFTQAASVALSCGSDPRVLVAAGRRANVGQNHDLMKPILEQLRGRWQGLGTRIVPGGGVQISAGTSRLGPNGAEHFEVGAEGRQSYPKRSHTGAIKQTPPTARQWHLHLKEIRTESHNHHGARGIQALYRSE